MADSDDACDDVSGKGLLKWIELNKDKKRVDIIFIHPDDYVTTKGSDMNPGRKDHLNDDQKERLNNVIILLRESGLDFMISDITGDLLKVSVWLGDPS